MAYDNPPLPPGLTLWTQRVPQQASRIAQALDHDPGWEPGKLHVEELAGQRFAWRDEYHTWTYRNGVKVYGHFSGVTLYDATGYDASAAPPTAPPDSPALLEGVDVSKWQESIDWLTVATAKSFAFIRVSDGLTHPDERFEENWRGACDKLARGAYQLFRPEESADAQAELFLARLAGDFGEIAPMIDVEVLDGVDPNAIAAGVERWIDLVLEGTQMTPVVYTTPNYWAKMPTTQIATKAGLVIAHWGVTRPSVPKEWVDWAFWQYANRGTCPGISGLVDLDRCNGASLPGLG